MKSLFIAICAALALSACSTTPLGGPDVAPICKDGYIKGVPGCYNGGA